MEIVIPDQLTTLGHPQRLAIFRLLARRYPDRVPAGEIVAALGAKPSTMSSYLATLQRSGLVMQERSGTSLLYSIDLAKVQQMVEYLLIDCCQGRVDLCMPSNTRAALMSDRKYNVLFICVNRRAILTP